MATLLTWGGKTLQVTPTQVYSFDDLEFGGSVKTKDHLQSGVNKVDSEALKAASYSCCAMLNAALGVDVQTEVCHWMKLCRSLCRSTLLISDKDVFGVPFMLVKCEAKKVRINGRGTWVRAELELEFEECKSGSPSTVAAPTISSTATDASNLLSWGGKTLSVSPTKVYSFEDIELSSAVKTKDDEQGGILKANSDGLKASIVECTVMMDARLGVDVKAEVESWIKLMRGTTRSNLQITGYDVFGCTFMLVKCEAKKVKLTGSSAWLSAELELEFEECTPTKVVEPSGGGGDWGGGGGSGGSSKSSRSKYTSYKAGSDVDVISGAAPKASSSSGGSLSGAIGGFVSAVKSVVSKVTGKKGK